MRWLLDEMLPPSTAAELNDLGHDAVAVVGIGLAQAADEDLYVLAVEQERIVVTENFADFARVGELRLAREQPVVPVVFVRKRAHPRGGALGRHLALHLHRWANDHPDPYPGPHWP